MARPAREETAQTLERWQRSPPRSPDWSSLRKFTGLSRAEVLGFDAVEWFVAYREGCAAQNPEVWATEKEAWRNIDFSTPPSIVREDFVDYGFSTDLGTSILILGVSVIREEGGWAIRDFGIAEIIPDSTPWDEPELVLPYIKGAAGHQPATDEIIVNVLPNGALIVGGERVDIDSLRRKFELESPRVLLRMDAAVLYRTAAPHLSLVARHAAEIGVVTAVGEDGRSSPKFKPPRKPGAPQLRFFERRVPLLLPGGDPELRLEIGSDSKVDVADLAVEGKRVLLDPAPDTTWSLVLRFYDALEKAGAVVLLARPVEGGVKEGVRVTEISPENPCVGRVIRRD